MPRQTWIDALSDNAKLKRSLVGVELVRLLVHEGDRLFTTDRARELAPRVGLSDAYVCEALHHLRKGGWIVSLRRGLYALTSTVPGAVSVHEFEVAMALTSPAVVSHWSALHYHGLTEQVPRTVFVLTTTATSAPRMRAAGSTPRGGRYLAGDTMYRFVRVSPDRLFGTEQVWIHDATVVITDLERTLLDGLSRPRYCGDFAEVLHAFEVAMNRMDVTRIAEYAIRLGTATAKRLGWILAYCGCESSEVDRLAELPTRGYRTLDPTGPRKGRCNARWMVQENLPGWAAE